ncbi:MAG: hypothetical protein SFU27_13910 [Thermonemataceae bacterium]|nr:hypothetical protein [Thermonemataceae bacterium]
MYNRKSLFLLLYLLLTWQMVWGQEAFKTDSSPIEVRKFKKERLQELRNNPDFDYSQEDVESYSESDADWQWKQWRYEQAKKNKNQKNQEIDIEKVRRVEGINYNPSFRLGENAIYIAAAIAIIFLLLFLLGINPAFLFRKNTKIKPDTFSEQDLTHLQKNDLDSQIQKALSNGNYNEAIRYAYLKSLWLLSQKSLVHIQKEKTNTEYLQELRNNKKKLYDDFSYQVRLFAYIKYGEFSLNKEQFERIYPQFISFYEKI